MLEYSFECYVGIECVPVCESVLTPLFPLIEVISLLGCLLFIILLEIICLFSVFINFYFLGAGCSLYCQFRRYFGSSRFSLDKTPYLESVR